ncbi:MAG: hypothetical protein ASARMPRED_009378 [Alectoria sarmentosa]|nr:MAG: hypothetical protein ASARMPRED_009378 [Alectoria sarmentosa]
MFVCTANAKISLIYKPNVENERGEYLKLDGQNLDIGKVVAISRYGIRFSVENEKLKKLEQSVRALHADLDKGKVIYGVNTGFGGSADTRTHGVVELQNMLIRELHSGILPTSIGEAGIRRQGKLPNAEDRKQTLLGESLYSNDYMPESWARASVAVRVNSLASGYSGVRSDILKSMIGLLKNDIVPLIPLRGSISASGDLMPLSYIGGALQGDPGVRVWARSAHDGRRRVTTADVALKESSLAPIDLRPKEGLALINGTAVSTGVAALAMHDANCLAVTSQVLTAMSVEALCGAKESFDPIFAKLRPHPGQIEAARNIHKLLAGSRLALDDGDHGEGSLRQDRYSTRTASQWIGPVLEDFLLANRQVTIECNSVTDNPLIDVERDGKSFHGGNFQAKAITSAMEKTRSGLQSIGQMLFAQCTELINPRLNFGLPPNLTADEPSESFMFKPVDIMIAALQSELGFLSNSAGSHVQSAEMGNQALNSLALISARYTHTALDVLTQLASAHVFALCQALDLRAMRLRFLDDFKPLLMKDTEENLSSVLCNKAQLQGLQSLLWHKFKLLLDQTTSMDTAPRFAHIFRSLQPVVLDAADERPETLPFLKKWSRVCVERATQSFGKSREEYSNCADATPLLGIASRRVYRYIRNELSIPFLRTKDLINLRPTSSPDTNGCPPSQPEELRSPPLSPDAGRKRKRGTSEQVNHTAKLERPASVADGCETMYHEHQVNDSSHRPEKRSKTSCSEKDAKGRSATVGSYISLIYEAFRSGSLYNPIFECLDEIKVV